MEEIAQVYARSLFEVAKDSGTLDTIREQLGQFADALEEDRDLAVFFFSPYFSTQEKEEGLKRVVTGADEIVARARKTGEDQEAKLLADGKVKREEMMEQTRREIEAETKRAIAEIRNEVAYLTVLATEKVTRKTLTDADQRRLVDEALGELDFDQLSGDTRRN